MGIVSFEYTGELVVARAMIESWGPQGQVYAVLNMGLDFLFLSLAYTLIEAIRRIACKALNWHESMSAPSA